MSLIDNPVTQMKNYRLFTIYAMQNLRVLDFQKVKKRERIEAEKLFKTEPIQPIEPIAPVEPIVSAI
jgi:U2 small nuclear ribonucleoprotein A'